MKDNSQINIERKNFQEQIQMLKNKDTLEYKSDEIFNTNIFYLPYHNRSDDKKILEDLSNTLSKIKGLVDGDSTMYKKTNTTYKNKCLHITNHVLYITVHVFISNHVSI